MNWTKTIIGNRIVTHRKLSKTCLVSFDEEKGKYNNFAVQQAKRGKKFYSSKVVFEKPAGRAFSRLENANAVVINRKAKTIEPMTEVGLIFHVRDFLRELKGHEKEGKVRRALLKLVSKLNVKQLMKDAKKKC